MKRKNRRLRIAANQLRRSSGVGGAFRQLAGNSTAGAVSEADKDKNQNVRILSEEILENMDGALTGIEIIQKARDLGLIVPGSAISGADLSAGALDALLSLDEGPISTKISNSPFDEAFDLFNEEGSNSAGRKAMDSTGTGSGRPVSSFAPVNIYAKLAKGNDKQASVALPGKASNKVPVAVLTAKHFDFCPTTALTSEIEVFANLIPSHEFSRCVPFLDVQFFTATKTFSTDGRPLSISLAKALAGNQSVSKELGTRQLARRGSESSVLNSDGTKRHNSSFGMEMFTLPQTYTPLKNSDRSVPILDPFRAFMSITSFDVSVVPAAGLMEKKKAKLSIILHDRSRLHEIAELIRPENYGTNELLIEYGWSHPDNTGRNVYGKFLNAMRQKEKFAVVNSSFSMGNNGEVNIDLDLFAKGNLHSERTSIFQSKNLQESGNMIGKITSKIRAILKDRAKGKMRKDISAFVSLDEGLMSNSTVFVPDKVAELLTNFEKEASQVALLGKDKSTVLKALDDLRVESQKFVTKKKQIIETCITELMENTVDPFLPVDALATQALEAQDLDTVKDTSFISVGKLFTNFVARPLASTGNFSEVQLMFYGFSSESGFQGDNVLFPLGRYSIDEFPISKSEFVDALNFMIQNSRGTDISVSTFMNWIIKNFIQYPFSPLSDPTPPQDVYAAITEKGRTLDTDDKSVKEKLKELTKSFRAPKIQVMFETLPKVGQPEESVQDADSASILRIHVYDNHNGRQAAFVKMLQAGSDTLHTIKGLNKNLSKSYNKDEKAALTKQLEKIASAGGSLVKKAESESDSSKNEWVLNIGFNELKKIIRQGYPTITYGAEGSIITSARFASIQSSGYKNVQLKRYGNDPTRTAKGTQPNGLPLQVQPADASLTMLGCPIIRYAQHFFVDFGTGTSVDDVYYVKTVNHRITPGSFTTSVSLYNRNADGQFESFLATLNKAQKLVEGSEDKSNTTG